MFLIPPAELPFVRKKEKQPLVNSPNHLTRHCHILMNEQSQISLFIFSHRSRQKNACDAKNKRKIVFAYIFINIFLGTFFVVASLK